MIKPQEALDPITALYTTWDEVTAAQRVGEQLPSTAVRVVTDIEAAQEEYERAVRAANWPNLPQHLRNVAEAITAGGALVVYESPEGGTKMDTNKDIGEAYRRNLQQVRASRPDAE